jgi:hypothetical protein
MPVHVLCFQDITWTDIDVLSTLDQITEMHFVKQFHVKPPTDTLYSILHPFTFPRNYKKM